MRQRCYNPSSTAYCRYGARGIAVCDRWRQSIDNFAADMGEPPPNTSLDRIDNDGHYGPENCRWAQKEQQARNTRQNRRLTFAGECLCVAAWADRLGIHVDAIFCRLKSGWSIERTLSTPVRPYTWR